VHFYLFENLTTDLKQNEIFNAYTQGILHIGGTQTLHEKSAVCILFIIAIKNFDYKKQD